MKLPEQCRRYSAVVGRATPRRTRSIRSKLVIEVLDRGSGIAPELRQNQQVVTTGTTGHGAGILIAQAAIELGRQRRHLERRSGGTCVRIELAASA